MVRNSPVWRLLQLNHPPIIPSKFNPIVPAMCSADMYERALLTLTEEEWCGVESAELQRKIDRGDSTLDDPFFAALDAQVLAQQAEQRKEREAESG